MADHPHISDDDILTGISDAEREQRKENVTRRLLSNARAEIEKLEKRIDLLTAVDSIKVSPAEWAQPRHGAQKDHRAVANLLLSDLHLDEVVDPEQMRGMNAYNREIAAIRLKLLGERTIKMARDHLSGVKYDGIYVWANGDLISGMIHEELERTNAGRGVVDTIDYWVDPLAGLLDQLADFFSKVHVVSTVGNHGRSYKKPPAKDAVRSSFDWLTMRCIWRELRGDARFTWNIPQSKDIFETVYATRFLVQHGDDFKGGDQVAGAIRPILFADMKSMAREVAAPGGEPYDCLVVSHFHQYNPLRRAIMNGSVVGYNEYVKDKLRARYEPPIQAFWLTTPENGNTVHLPILCGDRKKEGW